MSQQSGKQVILILEANPCGTEFLDSMAEVQAIRELLEHRRLTDRFDLQLRPRVTRNVFVEAIGRYKPTIVHFIGHGSESALCLENNRGQAASITHEDVVDVLKTYADDIECVMFNACNTHHHAQAVAEFIPAVVGTCDSINTQVATLYATRFYQGFFDAHCFKNAHRLGEIGIGQDRVKYQFYYIPREKLNRLKLLKDTWPNYLQLRGQLTGVLPQHPELRSLCQQCFPSGLMGILPRTDDMLEILDWVAERTLSDHHPPLLRLLKLLRERFESEVGEFIEAWLDEVCAEMGITLSDLSPHVPPPPLRQQDTPIYVMVEISPRNNNPSDCTAQAWVHMGEHTESILVRDYPDTIDVGSPKSITQFTDDLVDAMSESEYLHDRQERVVLEFILPLSMIFLDVDRWRTCDRHELRPSERWPINIRLQERIRSKSWHKRFNGSWKEINGKNALLLLRDCKKEISYSQFKETDHARLLIEAQNSAHCVIFDFSPSDNDLIERFLKGGIPVLLFPRQSLFPSEIGKSFGFNELLDGVNLLDLPKAVKELRRAAVGKCNEHIGKNITLLWDDKDRLPTIANLQSPQ